MLAHWLVLCPENVSYVQRFRFYLIISHLIYLLIFFKRDTSISRNVAFPRRTSKNATRNSRAGSA